jgi:DNA-binding CsgD family transcriptional regulator
VSVEGVGVEAAADWDHLFTLETYLGYGRSGRAYHWMLDGEWTIEAENVVLDQAVGSITCRFHGRDAHLVLSAGTRGRERKPPAWVAESVVELTEWLFAVLCNGLGRYQEAAAALAATKDNPQELFVAHVDGDGTARGCKPGATTRNWPASLSTAASRPRPSPAPNRHGESWPVPRALVSESDTAEDLYQEAIERLGRTRLRPELARAHLLYGEWLRRQNRRFDAREQLRTAYEMHVAIGMEAFAERARGELKATGGTARKRTVETRGDLTAQERQIARLARDGLSNPEIGARIFLSPRTVEWHLREVFTRLEIHSRHELPARCHAPNPSRPRHSPGIKTSDLRARPTPGHETVRP